MERSKVFATANFRCSPCSITRRPRPDPTMLTPILPNSWLWSGPERPRNPQPLDSQRLSPYNRPREPPVAPLVRDPPGGEHDQGRSRGAGDRFDRPYRGSDDLEEGLRPSGGRLP